jgi:hypothetical protein
VKIRILFSLAATLCILSAASAQVLSGITHESINDTTTGFVSKGAVQAAFGWNDHEMQAAALITGVTTEGYITFDYHRKISALVQCTWVDKRGRQYTGFASLNKERSGTVRAEVAYDLKRTGRKSSSGEAGGTGMTGFNVSFSGVNESGFLNGGSVTGIKLPVVNSPWTGCPGGSKSIVNWIQWSIDSTAKGLYVFQFDLDDPRDRYLELTSDPDSAFERTEGTLR